MWVHGAFGEDLSRIIKPDTAQSSFPQSPKGNLNQSVDPDSRNLDFPLEAVDKWSRFWLPLLYTTALGYFASAVRVVFRAEGRTVTTLRLQGPIF